ncbi:MAG: hypothetical protein QM756_02825 [Polyangiaceae bacterium]
MPPIVAKRALEDYLCAALMQLSELLLVHERLDEHFAVHQEHLLDCRLPEACATLDVYVELLGVHMRHEEELLLPIYARGEPSARFPLVLFTGQHQRMRELLAEARARLARLSGEGHALARGVIELLDFERTYKHLGEHHDGAERQALFPVLDRLATSDEQALVGGACLREWLEAERRLLRR